jgi:hypothetical protein
MRGFRASLIRGLKTTQGKELEEVIGQAEQWLYELWANQRYRDEEMANALKQPKRHRGESGATE